MSVTTCQDMKWNENFCTFLNVTQRIFDQSSSNFQDIWVYSSPTIKHTLLLWISTNVVSMATYLSHFIKISYIFDHNSKNIWSIFIKFSRYMGIVISYNQTYIVTMDIHQCCFYGNILVTFHQTFLHLWSLHEEYLINLHEIFRVNRCCPILYSEVYFYYGYQLMWLP